MKVRAALLMTDNGDMERKCLECQSEPSEHQEVKEVSQDTVTVDLHTK